MTEAVEEGRLIYALSSVLESSLLEALRLAEVGALGAIDRQGRTCVS
jgi:hypothetical protein